MTLLRVLICPITLVFQPNTERRNSAATDPILLNEQMTHKKVSDLNFSSRGLHFCNLNIHHILPKLNELRVIMAYENSPDIFGACETFLDPDISDNQLAVSGYDFLRKDRASIQNKGGGGVLLYFRNTLTCTRRSELEISKIETIWAEVELPNAKPLLICTVYHPPNVRNKWIDLFEEEASWFILRGDLLCLSACRLVLVFFRSF